MGADAAVARPAVAEFADAGMGMPGGARIGGNGTTTRRPLACPTIATCCRYPGTRSTRAHSAVMGSARFSGKTEATDAIARILFGAQWAQCPPA